MKFVAIFEEMMISLGVAYFQTAMFSVDASGGFGAECADYNTINMVFLKIKETPKSDGSSSSLA